MTFKDLSSSKKWRINTIIKPFGISKFKHIRFSNKKAFGRGKRRGFKFDIKVHYHSGRYKWELVNENRIAFPVFISAIHVSRVFMLLKNPNKTDRNHLMWQVHEILQIWKDLCRLKYVQKNIDKKKVWSFHLYTGKEKTMTLPRIHRSNTWTGKRVIEKLTRLKR